MIIKTILNRSRRDFTATYKCDWCEVESEGSGYDDANFHKNVVPNMVCKDCGKTQKPGAPPPATKYPEGFQV